MISFDLCATERAKVRDVWVIAMQPSLGGQVSVHPSTDDTLVTWFEFSKCFTKCSPFNCINLCPLEVETFANMLSSCLFSVCPMKDREV